MGIRRWAILAAVLAVASAAFVSSSSAVAAGACSPSTPQYCPSNKCPRLTVKNKVAFVHKNRKVAFRIHNPGSQRCHSRLFLKDSKGRRLLHQPKTFVIAGHRTRVVVVRLTRPGFRKLNRQPGRRMKAVVTLKAKGLRVSKKVVLKRR